MIPLPQAIVAIVVAQRFGELAWARHNTNRLMALGAAEAGANHYPLIVLLHAAWFVSLIAFLPKNPTISTVPLTLFVMLQIVRGWVLFTLGSYFTTRIITMHNAPLVRRGPYRFIRHPNYLVVMGEILLLPLALREIGVAVLFAALNALLLFWRIRVEDRALAPRQHIHSS